MLPIRDIIGEANLKNEKEQAHDHDIHRGTGQGDQQFLDRPLGNALEPGHSADRQERDIGGRHTELPRGQGVPQFVQHHAAEQAQNESPAFEGRT